MRKMHEASFLCESPEITYCTCSHFETEGAPDAQETQRRAILTPGGQASSLSSKGTPWCLYRWLLGRYRRNENAKVPTKAAPEARRSGRDNFMSDGKALRKERRDVLGVMTHAKKRTRRRHDEMAPSKRSFSLETER